MDYHIYNAFPFEDETQIIETLKEETKEWDINSVNELKIVYNPTSTSRDVIVKDYPQKPLSDWYHLEIKNRTKSKHAFSCSGYVTRIKDLKKNIEYEIPTNELVWSGIGDIMVNIMADTTRELDAFFIIHGEKQIHFHQRRWTTSNPQYRLPNLPQGKYLIEYTIISSNFEEASQNYILEFEGSVKNVVFREAD